MSKSYPPIKAPIHLVLHAETMLKLMAHPQRLAVIYSIFSGTPSVEEIWLDEAILSWDEDNGRSCLGVELDSLGEYDNIREGVTDARKIRRLGRGAPPGVFHKEPERESPIDVMGTKRKHTK